MVNVYRIEYGSTSDTSTRVPLGSQLTIDEAIALIPQENSGEVFRVREWLTSPGASAMLVPLTKDVSLSFEVDSATTTREDIERVARLLKIQQSNPAGQARDRLRDLGPDLLPRACRDLAAARAEIERLKRMLAAQ